MTGYVKMGNKTLIRCGLVLGVICGGSVVLGDQLIIQQRAVAWECGVGMPFVPGVQTVPIEQTQDGFSVAASGTAIEDTPAGEALKLIEAGQWVKAIQAIESLSETDSKLVLDQRGVLRPLSAMKSALIASMPEEGRRVFTRLNDPAANTKLDEALATEAFDERVSAFKSIVDDYALCDAAAVAAEHMGDLRFEQGRFNEAAAYYRFASQHPATTADDPGMMVRRLTALSRADQWQAFDDLAEYARFRHPDTKVTIAGQDTAIQSFIAELAAARDAEPAQPNDTPTRLAMPKAEDLEYDRPLIAEDHFNLIRIHASNNRVGGIIEQIIEPVVAADNDRLFTLSLGSVARHDPETGTELWRVGDQNATVQKMSQRMYQIAGGFHQSLVIHGDTVLAAMPAKGNNLNAYLVALSPNDGEVKWSSYDLLRKQNETVVGRPLVIDDLIYFVTYRSTQELTLRSVRLADGAEVGKLALGRASKGPNMNTPAELSPRLTMGQSHLLVQTNNGALIAVDPNNLSIAWAFTQKIRQSGINMMRRHGQAVADPLARHTGEVVSIDGLVVAKDTRTNRVVALREYDAAMVWTADSDADATIVHHDSRHIYVLGEELVALDRQTGERVWWTPHAGKQAGKPIFTEDACLIAGSAMFCRVDLKTGKLTRYREDFTSPDTLHVVGNQLIRVGERRIAAIKLP